jgi:hypothetical protein
MFCGENEIEQIAQILQVLGSQFTDENGVQQNAWSFDVEQVLFVLCFVFCFVLFCFVFVFFCFFFVFVIRMQDINLANFARISPICPELFRVPALKL